MQRILTMAWKDIRLILRDRMSLFFIAGFPVLMGLFFGLVMGSSGSSGGTGKIKVAIVDQDDSEISRSFVKALQKNDSLLLEVADLPQARESVRKGSRVGMIALPPGFGERAGLFWGDPPRIELGLDPSRAAETAMLQGFIMQGIGDLVGQRFQNPDQFRPVLQQSRQDVSAADLPMAQRLLFNTFFDSLDAMLESADSLQDGSAENSPLGNEGQGLQFADIQTIDVSRQVDPDSVSGQVSKLRSRWDISFPQAMLWGVLSCVTGFAISIARERTQGTFTRLKVAPIRPQSILAGKALACFLTSLAVVFLMTVLGTLLGMRPASYLKLAAASVCVATAFTGIMMIIAVIGKTEQGVSGAGMGIILVLAMLGGCMIPAMFLPGLLQSISFVSPVRWAIQAIEGAIWREFSWAEMLPSLSVLLGVGGVCFCIGNQMLKRQSV